MSGWVDVNRKKWSSLCPALLILSFMHCVTGDNVTRSGSTRSGPFREPRFVSFDTSEDKLRVELELAVPFLSIPLKPGQSSMGSLVNINPQALVTGAVFVLISTLFIPLFFGSKNALHHRSNDFGDTWIFPETVSGILLRNPYVVPCTKKFICSVVSHASQAKNQTNLDKIIDGISSYEWFGRMVEGTAIQEAIIAGRRTGSNCNAIYSRCFLSQKLFENYPSPKMNLRDQ